MRTKIKCLYEETIIDPEEKTFGILLNDSCDENYYKDSIIYLYQDNLYTFFRNLLEASKYISDGNTSIQRAFMPETDFDELLDSEDGFEGKFEDRLEWV